MKKNRRQHRHVGSVGAATEIRVIGDERITLVNFLSAVVFQDACGASRKCAHMQRQYHVLGDDFALAIQDCAAGVLRLPDDR